MKVLAVFGIRVHGIVVAGQSGELHQVRFRDGTASAAHGLANFKLLEVQPARSIGFHFEHARLPFACVYSNASQADKLKQHQSFSDAVAVSWYFTKRYPPYEPLPASLA